MKKIILIILLIFYLPRLFAPPIIESLAATLVNVKEVTDKIELDLYLEAIHISESPGSWCAINSLGCAGGYQLSKVALQDIGYRGTIRQFINSKELQKKLMVQLLKKNKKYLEFYGYDKYIGKTVHGIKITLSAALSACHLCGIGGFGRFIKEGHNATDGNETTIKYLLKFQNYNLNGII